MKRKIFATILTTALILSLTACGGQEPNADTNSQPAESITTEAPAPTPTTEPTNEPVVEPTSEPVEDNTTNENGVVDSGTIDDSLVTNENNVSSSNAIRYDYTFENSVASAWQRVSTINSNSKMANHTIHFTNSKGYPMTYSIVALNSLCDNSYIDAGEGTTCCIYDNNYELRMWGCNFENGDSISDYDMNTVTTWSYGTYIEDTYQVEKTDEFCRIIFKVDFNGTMTGYACYIDYYDTMEGYQFEYLESNDVFDDERALSVVQSIERVKITE